MSDLFPCLAILISLTAAPAPAARDEAADPEQLSQDLIKNVDGWIGQINTKLQSDKPVGSEDFDSFFNDSFFSGSDDPIRDIELVQKKINSKLGEKQKNFDASYGKWVSDKMSAADLSPEVVSDDKHITVNLKNQQGQSGSMKVKVDGKRIKISYLRKEKRQKTNPDGSLSPSSFMKRNQRIMAVPAGADPDRYKVRSSKSSVSVIFDRTKGGKHTEASK